MSNVKSVEIDGQKLSTVRLEMGLSPKDVSKSAKITASYLVALENNRLKPSLAMLGKLAAFYGVKIGDLVIRQVPDEKEEEQRPHPSG